MLAKVYQAVTSGQQGRGTVFKEIRPGAGFKTGDFVKDKLGGLPQNDSEDSSKPYWTTKTEHKKKVDMHSTLRGAPESRRPTVGGCTFVAKKRYTLPRLVELLLKD